MILFDSSCEEAVNASLLESENRKKIKRLRNEFKENVSLGYICLWRQTFSRSLFNPMSTLSSFLPIRLK